MVLKSFSGETWREICLKAGVDDDSFEAMKTYPDSVTFNLVAAASERLQMPVSDVLRCFGEYWITFTAEEGYGPLMDLFGQDLRTSLMNLNRMHSHMGAMMPALQPPRFEVVTVGPRDLVLHYYSSREGLGPMVEGMVLGMAKKFNSVVEVKHHAKGSRSDHDEFDVRFAA